MKSAVSMLRLKSQQCAIHGLHNALKEVLKMDSLKNICIPSVHVDDDSSEDEDAADNATDAVESVVEAEAFDDPLSLSVKELVAKVRETFKTIKRSGPKRDRLRALTALPCNNANSV